MSNSSPSNDLDRREMLGTMGLAAAAGLTLAGAVSGADAVPAPGVEDRGTGGPNPFSGNPGDVMGLVKGIENLRKEKGPDHAIMFDAHCAIPPAMLIQFAAAIEPYNILWLEEPACPGNIEVFKRLKQQI